MICASTRTSSAVVGSSATTNAGRSTRVSAIISRWRIPLENCAGTRGSGWVDPHQPQHLQRAPVDLALADGAVVGLERLGEVVADPHQRVQPGQRLLEDHAEVAAAHGVLLLRLELEHVGAAESQLAVAGAPVGQQPDQAASQRRLAAARLPHQTEDLARVQVEAHAVDRTDRTTLGAVPDPQVAYLEHRVPGYVRSPGRLVDDVGHRTAASLSASVGMWPKVTPCRRRRRRAGSRSR